jgi:hypothetical protein
MMRWLEHSLPTTSSSSHRFRILTRARNHTTLRDTHRAARTVQLGSLTRRASKERETTRLFFLLPVLPSSVFLLLLSSSPHTSLTLLSIQTPTASHTAPRQTQSTNDRTSNVHPLPTPTTPHVQITSANTIFFSLQSRPRRPLLRPSSAPGGLDRAVGRYGQEVLLRTARDRHVAMGDAHATCAHGPHAPGHAPGRDGTSVRDPRGRRTDVGGGRRWGWGEGHWGMCAIYYLFLSGIVGGVFGRPFV